MRREIEALCKAVRAGTPAARTAGLPSPTVSAAEAPPAPAADTASPTFRLGRSFAAHTQATVVVGLVAVTTIATGLVMGNASRQLDLGPGPRTTPYLATRPSEPIRMPVRGLGTAPPAEPAAPPRAEQPEPGTPPETGLPELALPPVPPATSRHPEIGQPRLSPPPGPPTRHRCHVKARGFLRCVLRPP